MAAVLSRRRAPFLIAALVLVVGVVALVLLLRGGGDNDGRTAARAEPLAYLPDGANDAVFDLDTRAPLVDLAVEQLAPRLTHGALTAEQVRPLVGGRAVVALRGDRAWLVFASEPDGFEDEQPLAAAPDGSLRVADDPGNPEHVRFDTEVGGRALRAWLSGWPYYRVG